VSLCLISVMAPHYSTDSPWKVICYCVTVRCFISFLFIFPAFDVSGAVILSYIKEVMVWDDTDNKLIAVDYCLWLVKHIGVAS